MITRIAPAKINLTLEVLGKRPDGYHEIKSVVQAISLADTLTCEDDDTFTFGSDMPDWEGEKSLVSKAAALLKEQTGTSKGASIFVNKRIPLLSGLGGDSSDAAAALAGLSELWRLELGRDDLIAMGRTLGSDVAFFFYGGTGLMEGRGEIVTPLNALPHRWLVVALPSVERLPGKTRSLYQSLTPNHYTDGGFTRRMADDVSKGNLDSSLLFNTFENVAFALQPGLEVARQHILKMGAPNLHLAGSGPTLFSICDGESEAKDLCTRINGQNIEALVAETLPGGQT